MSEDTAADVLTGTTTLSGTVTVDGQTVEYEMQEPSFADLETVEADLEDNADELVLARAYIDAFLESPDVDAGEIGVGRALALFKSMQETIVSSSGIADAIDEMPLDDEGNG
jgi:hypothetical protein